MSDKAYIITFAKSADTASIENLYKEIESQGSVIHKKKHDSAIMKYSVATLPENLFTSLQGNDIVESIEEDSTVSIQPISQN